MIEWMGMMSKELGGYLQICDTRQQEAWLRWLLLKEFGHHLANTLPKSRRLGKRWMDTCIIEQHRVWIHGVDMILISFIMSSSHVLYDESMRRQQILLLLGLYLRKQGKIFSHIFHDVVGVEDGTIIVQRGYSLALDVQEGISSWE